MSITATPIGTKNLSFLIDANIRSAPAGLMLREFLKNCFEAHAVFGEKIRSIRLYADDDNKLVMINSGRGMTPEELRDCTEMSSSSKEMGLEGGLNRGEGAKLSSLVFNPLGLRYRSRRNGLLYEVFLFRDPVEGWARKREETWDDDGVKHHDEVYYVGNEHLTETERERYAAMSGDFTEVKLFGRTAAQQTAYDPYGVGKIEKLTVGKEICNRFYEFPKVFDTQGNPMKVRVQMESASFRSHGSLDSFRPVLSIKDVVKRYPHFFTNLDERNVLLPNGVRIEYLNATEQDKHHSVWSQKSMGANGNRAAVVWRGEMYSVLEGEAWRRASPTYGLVGVTNTLSVFVHLPDDLDVTDDRYREVLRRIDSKEPISFQDYKDAIILNKPQWLKDLVDSKRPTAILDSQDVRDQLVKFAAKLYVKPDRTSAHPNLTVIEGGRNRSTDEVGPGGDQPTTPEATDDGNTGSGGGGSGGQRRTDGPGHGPGEDGTGGVSKRRKRAPASAGGSKTANHVPHIEWIDNLDDHPNLKGRGADYVGGAEATLFLNPHYGAVNMIVDTFYEDDKEMIHRDVTEPFVRNEALKHIALRVGIAVLRVLHKQGDQDWPDNAIQAALTPEALSNVVDALPLDISGLLRSVRQKPEFRALTADRSVQAVRAVQSDAA